ncbi:MAG TPA: cytochrome c [Polyangia bacterium]
MTLPPSARSLGRGGLALAVCLAGLSSGCTTPGDDPGPPIPVDPAQIYAQMCARCHGGDGRGDPEIKKTLPVRDFSDPQFQARATTDEIGRTIMAGKNQMPAFGGMLSMPKIQAMSGYVRRLGRQPQRAP